MSCINNLNNMQTGSVSEKANAMLMFNRFMVSVFTIKMDFAVTPR